MAKKVERLVAKAALRVIDISEVGIDPSYQRSLAVKHKRIATEFNPEALGVPVVGEREDGTKWVVDGQQRLAALKILGRKTVRAEVFASRGPEHEAEVFKIINLNRTKLRATDIFFALLTAHDETAWMVKRVVEECGFVIPKGGASMPRVKMDSEHLMKNIYSVKALLNIAARKGGGEPCLRFVLETIRAAWPADPMRTKHEVMMGLYNFYVRHEGKVDSDRLIPRLSKTTCAKLLYSAQLGVGSPSENVGEVLEKVYRKRYAGRG